LPAFKNGWAPGIGFAWSPRDNFLHLGNNTVFRGGYRVSYDPAAYITERNRRNYEAAVTYTPGPRHHSSRRSWYSEPIPSSWGSRLESTIPPVV
jgi:hypothetical protein